MKIQNLVRRAAKVFLASAILTGPVARGANVDYFADNGFGKPLSTLQHPSGEHFKTTTYIAYQGPHEDAYVAAYNHSTKKWSGPVLAGVSPMGKTPDPVDNNEVDNHGKPAMMVDNKGYIHLVFGSHGGNPNLGKNKFGTPAGFGHGGKQTHIVSKNPEDITSWRVVDNISPFGTYPQFMQMDDGDIYLFYRHGSHQSDWVYQKSSDDGLTFSSPVSVIKHKLQAEGKLHDAWYAWFAKGKGDTITASYIYHPCSYPNHTKDRLNVYYMKMNCADDSWENAVGEKLAISVTKEYADQKTLVLNSGKGRCNHGTCRVDQEGHPHLLFRYEAGQVRYTRWTGNAWTEPVAVISDGSENGQDGDMIVESPTSVRMILTRTIDGKNEVACWKTEDGGKTWAKEPSIFSRPGGGFDIGALIENHTAEAMVVVSEGRVPEHLYRKMVLLGKDGPLQRPEAETSYIQKQLEILKKSGVKPTPKEERKAKKAKTGDDE